MSAGASSRKQVIEGLSRPQRLHLEKAVEHYSDRGWLTVRGLLWMWSGPEYVGPSRERPGLSRGIPTYMAVHHRLRRERGSVRSMLCDCGRTADTWAYDHRDPNEVYGESKHGRGDRRAYSVNLEHYDPLCFKCHVQRDR